MKKSIQLLSFLALLMLSCETIVEVDLPEHESKLVVSGLVSAGALPSVIVSNSVDILGTAEPQIITNANVSIWQDDVQTNTLSYNPVSRVYESNSGTVIPADKTIELRVSAEGYDDINAIGYTPSAPIVQNVETEIGESTFGFRSIRVSFEIIDASTDDFYQVNVFQPQNEFGGYSLYFTSTNASILESNTSFEFDDEQRFAGDLAIFDDALFNATTTEVVIDVETFNDEIPLLLVSKISEDVYFYQRSRSVQNENGDNPFSEPIRIFSNVKNGYGIFGGLNTVATQLTP